MDVKMRDSVISAACLRGCCQDGNTRGPLALLNSSCNHWNLSLLDWAATLTSCSGGCVMFRLSQDRECETGSAVGRKTVNEPMEEASGFFRFTGVGERKPGRDCGISWFSRPFCRQRCDRLIREINCFVIEK